MGTLGIIFSLVVVVVMASLNINIIFSSLVASAVALLCNGMPVLATLADSYQSAFGSFISSYLLMLLLGAVYGYFMEKSGCAASFANALIHIFGRKFSTYSLVIVVGLLVYGGIKALVTVFIMLPIMVNVFKESDTPRRFIPVIIQFAGGNYANSGPGSPSVLNMVVTSTMGVSPTAGGIPGIVGTIVVLVSGLLFLKLYIDHAHKNGEHYVPKAMDAQFEIEQEHLPSPWIAAFILVSVPVCLNFTIDGKNVFTVIEALCIGNLLCILLNLKRLDLKAFVFHDVEPRLTQAIGMMACLSAMSGFGRCISVTAGYQSIVDAVLSIPGSPYLKLIIAVSLVSAVTGGATSACNIIAPALGPTFVSMGISPGYVARLMAITGTGLDSMPNNGGILGIMQVCGEELKDAYPPFVSMTIIAPLIGAVVMAVMCNIIG